MPNGVIRILVVVWRPSDEVSLGEWQETQIAILLCESSLLRAHRRELFARTRNSVHILRSQVLRRSVQIQSQNLPKSQEGLMMRRPKFGRSRIISICKQPKKSSLNLVSPIAGTIGHWRHAWLRQSAMTVSGKPTVIYPITGINGCCARATSGHAAALPRRLHRKEGVGP